MNKTIAAVGSTVVAAVTAAIVVLPGSATAAAETRGQPERARVQRALERAVSAGAPGAVAEVRDGPGRWLGSAGVSDTATGRAREPNERFRIGSATKAFTATVVLQLAADRRLRLDDTVDRWLPGLVRGNGNDGAAITIRQLLNQTSGLYAYSNDPAFFVNGIGDAWFEHRPSACWSKGVEAPLSDSFPRPGSREVRSIRAGPIGGTELLHAVADGQSSTV